MDKILNISQDKILYSPMIGIYPTKINLYTPFINDVAKVFFNIMDKSKIEYYVIAGSAIGLIRNQKSIPWVDDYDIIIFDKDVFRFDMLIKQFKKHYFEIKRNQFDKLLGYTITTPKYLFNNTITSQFRVDVFITKIAFNRLYNVGVCGRWGLFDINNKPLSIPISIVKPAKKCQFDDLILPFFNDYEKDVKIEYGDIINKSIIHINHGKQKIIINKYWNDVYNDFYELENKAKYNTLNEIINYNSQIQYNKLNLDQDYVTDLNINSDNNYIEFMNYIYKSNKKRILIYNNNNVRYVYDLKYYIKDIQIDIIMKTSKCLKDVYFMINCIDNIIVPNNDIKKIINKLFIDNKKINIVINPLIDYNLTNEKLLLRESPKFIKRIKYNNIKIKMKSNKKLKIK